MQCLANIKKKIVTTNEELEQFVKENADQLKRDLLILNMHFKPKKFIGLEEFNQDFFDEIDEIENKISQGDDFESILEEYKCRH